MNSSSEWISVLKVNDSLIPFKLDTGAQANVLSLKDFKSLINKPKLIKRKIGLQAYNGESIPVAGVCHVQLDHNGQKIKASLVIVSIDTQPILGLTTCEKMGLVKRIHVINKDKAVEKTTMNSDIILEYDDVFQGVGCLPVEYEIKLADNAIPVIHPARKVPHALKPRLRAKLDELEKDNIIQRVTKPTEWVSSLVIIEKKDKSLRLCLDPKDLNKYISREHQYIPTRSEILSEMAGATVFTKLDASQAFYQIPLANKSTKLCTFNTPFGRYCFNRLCFGLSSASEVMHRTIAQLIDGIEGVKSIHDDIIIWGKGNAEHNQRVRRVLDIARKSNLKLNKEKCQFNMPSVMFFGEKISSAGVEIDQEKIKAITNMPVPQSKEDLQ